MHMILFQKLKQKLDIPIQLHSHYTSGMASMTYLKAIEAGVDVIDTAMSPFALVHLNRQQKPWLLS